MSVGYVLLVVMTGVPLPRLYTEMSFTSRVLTGLVRLDKEQDLQVIGQVKTRDKEIIMFYL